MKVQFFGAAKTVTGSCYMVEACGARFTIDCGMHQGNKAMEERNYATEAYRPSDINFVLMTHAHIDHSGLVPRMVNQGFKGPIYGTAATNELMALMLLDSAHIQEMEAQWKTGKYKRRGQNKTADPLYTTEDAAKSATLFRTVDYHKTFEPHPGIKVTYYDAGHILGSAFILLELAENGDTLRVLFSGDIGRPHALIVRDPEFPPKVDYIFMESTYGDRDHKNEDRTADELAEAIAYSYSKREKVLIPAFAVERTQEVLISLAGLSEKGLLPSDMPVYVDSPLAIRATEVFRRHKMLFDDSTRDILDRLENNEGSLPKLTYTLNASDSQALNDLRGPAIIISASGMCNAGRIRHHLKHNIWRPGVSVVFVGYQGIGTPGRKIVEGAKSLNLFGEDVQVSARIFTLGGFSAHAGQSQLLDWLGHAAVPGTHVVLTHGEEAAQTVLAGLIEEKYGLKSSMPGYLEELELSKKVAVDVAPVLPRRYEDLAAPRIDWAFLSEDIEGKWVRLKGKLDTLEQRPWVEQTDVRERMEKLSYELTKLISGM